MDLSPKEEAALQAESLGEKIELIMDKLPPKEVTLSDILHIVRADGLMLLTILLSLVFLVPVSIPGLSTVFGAAILLIAVSRLLSRDLQLPRIIADHSLSTEKLRGVLNRALVWFHRLAKISRPHRLLWLTSGSLRMLFYNLSFMLAALLLMAPWGFIPLSNTLPAIALIFLSVGLLQRDGGFIMIGYLANTVTILYFGVLIVGSGLSFQELLQVMSL